MTRILSRMWDELDTVKYYGYRYFFTDKDANVLTIGFFVAIIVAIIVYFTFMSHRNENRFKGFSGWLYEVLNFRKLIMEALLKITYMFCAIFLSVLSFVIMGHDFWFGLLCLVLYNIVIRIVYELLLIIILTYKNISEINGKMKKENRTGNDNMNGKNTYNIPPQQNYGQSYGQQPFNQQPNVNQYQSQNQFNQRQPQQAQMQGMQGNSDMNRTAPVSQSIQQPVQQPTPQNATQQVQQKETAPLPRVQDIRSCPKCGTMLEQEDAFCPNCGNDVRGL